MAKLTRVVGCFLMVGTLLSGGSVSKGLAEGLSASAVEGSARFVRLGLNKSMVIALPEPARDVLIGNPGVVDAVIRTKTTAYLFAKGVGQTNIFIFDEDGRQIANLDVEVAIDSMALQKLLNRSMPESQVKIDTINDNVILSGKAKSAEEARKIVDLTAKFLGGDGKKAEEKIVNNLVITGKDQVMLRVRVAEVQRSVLKQLGIDMQAALTKGSFAVGLVSANPFTLSPSATGGSLAKLSAGNDRNNVSAVLTAYEKNGLLRTLAEPTLTAISGESAKFLAGGEFPIPIAEDNNKISVQFKPFGVGLGFTPVVLSEGRISLRISSEVSEVTNENSINLPGLTLPGLNVRRAETTVELPSGGSMAMAGLIQDRTKQDINSTPGVRDLPILGQLFRSRDFLSNETELVVIVTPYIVDSVNENKLATPLDHLNVAEDRDTLLLGHLNKVYGAGRRQPKGVYRGRIGYIIE